LKRSRTPFDRLGLPEAEQKYMAGVGAQYIRDGLPNTGIACKEGRDFHEFENGLKQHPDLFREHFASVVAVLG
jgi:Fe-S cluster assembly protein SufB